MNCTWSSSTVTVVAMTKVCYDKRTYAMITRLESHSRLVFVFSWIPRGIIIILINVRYLMWEFSSWPWARPHSCHTGSAASMRVKECTVCTAVRRWLQVVALQMVLCALCTCHDHRIDHQITRSRGASMEAMEAMAMAAHRALSTAPGHA